MHADTQVAVPVIAETLPEMAERIALEHEVSTSTLADLVWSESRWDPDASNAGGDRGLVQINKWSHPEVSDAQAYNPEFALNFAASSIAAGTEEQFVVCNCYAYLKTRLKELPRMADIVPNGTPKIGSVAVFFYRDKQTGKRVKHVALIEKMSDSGFMVAESNFTKCLFDRRFIDWNDPHLIGFWNP